MHTTNYANMLALKLAVGPNLATYLLSQRSTMHTI